MYIKKQPASIKRKKQLLLLSAEKEGFEPPEPLSSTVFKTAAIDHSAISPICMQVFFNCSAKVVIIFE